jgi:hypothetical protein
MSMKISFDEPDIHESAWTHEVELVLSALDCAHADDHDDRRNTARLSYQVVALLSLFCETDDAPAIEIYTRDADTRGIGFITKTRLPLGYGGRLRIRLPDGSPTEIACTVLRCRACAGDWFEGALSFNRPQPDFAHPSDL